MVGEVRRIELGDIPAGQIGMNPIVERRVVAHLLRHRPEEMPMAELVVDIDVEVADHHDPALGPDALLAAAELAGLHVALEDVHALLRVEGDARHLVETDRRRTGPPAHADLSGC